MAVVGKGYVGIAAMMALAAAPVRAGCWTADDGAAATVRELQSVLMVGALRCAAMKHDISADYNAFLTARTEVIGRMNARIRAHFDRDGASAAQAAYDAYATSLANAHGGDATDADTCDSLAGLAREAADTARSPEGLVMLAMRSGMAASLPGGACGRSRGAPDAAAGEPAILAAPAVAPELPAVAIAAGETVAEEPPARVAMLGPR